MLGLLRKKHEKEKREKDKFCKEEKEIGISKAKKKKQIRISKTSSKQFYALFSFVDIFFSRKIIA